MKGTLFLFPVPLHEGSPESIPAYHMELLRQAGCIIAENARSARRAMRSLGYTGDLNRLTWFELSEHSKPGEFHGMLEPCRSGIHTFLMSEAGCPGIADPGSQIVRIAHTEEIPVKALPGPSSIVLGLMASGLTGQRFTFHGYLPKEKDPRSRLIRQINVDAQKGESQIFIETPYRNQRLLEELLRELSLDTLLCVACELTSPAESVITLPVREWKKKKFDYDKKNVIFIVGS